MINKYLEYAKGLGSLDEATRWISLVLNNYLAKNTENQAEIEHIIDYLISDAAPKRLLKMSYGEALSNATKWSEANQKRGRDIIETDTDTETIHTFEDGSRVAKLLTKQAYEREGFLMRHCLGGYDPGSTEIYSYRDKKNDPHATFEVTKDGGEINQIKGKGNGPIHPRYIEPILEFLKHIDIDVRPDDMQNLGYYHVPKDAMDLVLLIEGAADQLVEVRGEKYAYDS